MRRRYEVEDTETLDASRQTSDLRKTSMRLLVQDATTRAEEVRILSPNSARKPKRRGEHRPIFLIATAKPLPRLADYTTEWQGNIVSAIVFWAERQSAEGFMDSG